jgi:predicted transcriptional regulator
MLTLDDMMKELPPARRKKIETRARKLIVQEMTLQELRKNLKLTQAQMARKLGVGQMQISRIENRKDIHVSTLRRVVRAMGGDLQLVVKVPGRSPVIISELDVAS